MSASARPGDFELLGRIGHGGMDHTRERQHAHGLSSLTSPPQLLDAGDEFFPMLERLARSPEPR
ncbi:hypothetical protein [Streptomyces sp. NPDC051738]|uniref:hypothetical protein n=1 Tax=Streptomyces sp. NPDC051738 TaxID=3365672 RepID=UPI0037D0A0D1